MLPHKKPCKWVELNTEVYLRLRNGRIVIKSCVFFAKMFSTEKFLTHKPFSLPPGQVMIVCIRFLDPQFSPEYSTRVFLSPHGAFKFAWWKYLQMWQSCVEKFAYEKSDNSIKNYWNFCRFSRHPIFLRKGKMSIHVFFISRYCIETKESLTVKLKQVLLQNN